MSAEDAPPPALVGLRRLTPARIGLARSGAGLSTGEVLGFALDHARARDAVHAAFDPDRVAADLAGLGLETITVASAAATRQDYLRRPDWGRTLQTEDRSRLAAQEPVSGKLLIVIGDGLSARAVHDNAVPFMASLMPRLAKAGIAIGTVVLARQARVALGDEIGEILAASAVLVLIGERPGLSSPDSLGAYLTVAPRRGRADSERNCISNIRPAGLSAAEAAHKAAWLVTEALRRGVTGVALKDESGPMPTAFPGSTG